MVGGEGAGVGGSMVRRSWWEQPKESGPWQVSAEVKRSRAWPLRSRRKV